MRRVAPRAPALAASVCRCAAHPQLPRAAPSAAALRGRPAGGGLVGAAPRRLGVVAARGFATAVDAGDGGAHPPEPNPPRSPR